MTADLEIQQRIGMLTDREIRILGLLSLGWENKEIGKRLHISEDTVKTYLRRVHVKLKLRSSRVTLAVFYVNYLLASDCEPDYKPGQKLYVWRKQAEGHRERLRAAGTLTPKVVEAVMLLTNPEHAGKSSAELGALLRGDSGEPLTADQYKALIAKISKRLPGRGGMARIAAIALLAPFDAPLSTPRHSPDPQGRAPLE